MCTRAPVVGVSSSKREAVMAAKLMHMDRAMLHHRDIAPHASHRHADVRGF